METVDAGETTQLNLLEEFKTRVENGISFVMSMNAEDLVIAVQFWNTLSQRLQEIICQRAEAAEIEAIEELALDLEQTNLITGQVIFSVPDGVSEPNASIHGLQAVISQHDSDNIVGLESDVSSLLNTSILVSDNLIDESGLNNNKPKGSSDELSLVNVESSDTSSSPYNKEEEEEALNDKICAKCNKIFINNNRLTAHKSKCGLRKSLNCPLCGMRFTNLTKLEAHQRNHEGRTYICPKADCGMKFYAKVNFSKHSRTHADVKPWKCSVCLKTFAEERSLKVHMRNHTGDRPYRCDVCGKTFTQSGVLTSHLAIHTKLKSFKCEECGRRFCQKSHLVVHMKRHAGVTRFTCSDCGFQFLTKGDMLRHKRRHTGERPFSCKLCDKSFARRVSLTEHLNRHYGRKPYSCMFCLKTFPEMSACYKHIKTHNSHMEGVSEKQLSPDRNISTVDFDSVSLVHLINKNKLEKKD